MPLSAIGRRRVAASGGALLVAVFAVWPPGVPHDVFYLLVGQVAALVAFWGAAHRCQLRPARLALAVSVQLTVLADALWTFDELVRGVETPFPSAADAVYLSAYPFMAVGLWWGVRRRSEGVDWNAVVDAVVVACGMAAVSWTFLMREAIGDSATPFLERAVSLAYPVLDVVLLAVAVRVLMDGRRPTATMVWMLAAVTTTVVADVGFALVNRSDGYGAGSVLDTVWLASLWCWAVALADPSRVELVRDRSDQDVATSVGGAVGTTGGWRFSALGVGALTPITCLLLWARTRDSLDAVVVTILSIVAFLAVVIRLGRVLRSLNAASAELAQAHDTRRELLGQVVDASERERIRVAGTLHDGPLQGLVAIGFDLEIGAMALEERDLDEVRDVLERARDGLSGEISAIRSMMSSLRPPVLDERGLAQAIEDHVAGVRARHGLDVEVLSRVEVPIDRDTETLLFRATQEALSNAVRHANADNVRISLVVSHGSAHLRIADDGVGYVPDDLAGRVRDGHFGLAGLDERVGMAGGVMRIGRGAAGGTELVIEIPIVAEAAATALPVG